MMILCQKIRGIMSLTNLMLLSLLIFSVTFENKFSFPMNRYLSKHFRLVVENTDFKRLVVVYHYIHYVWNSRVHIGAPTSQFQWMLVGSRGFFFFKICVFFKIYNNDILKNYLVDYGCIIVQWFGNHYWDSNP